MIALGVDEEDALKLTYENKILRCVAACKRLHNGPLTTVDELDHLLETWQGTEKALHSSLNVEIRLRKLTFTKIKADCQLFKQRNLSIDQKFRNLKSLIDSQLEFKTLADMTDLESAIMNTSITADHEHAENEDRTSLPTETTRTSSQEISNKMDWPPKKDDYIYGLFEDGVSPGKVVSATADEVSADFLIPATVPMMKGGKSLEISHN